MAPAKTAGRSRRTQSYSWSSDSSAVRPVYEWPDHPEDGVTALRDADHHRTSPRASPTAGVARGKLYEGDEDDPSVDTRAASRAAVNHGTTHLGPKIITKINYDSDSCLTPRSRRTLRRTLSGSTEPWPSVTAPAARPTLDTIYSPTHEILHPMQSLMLAKSLDSPAAGIGVGKPLTVSFVTVRATSQGQFTPTRMTQSVDFDSAFKTPQQPLELENYALNFPEQELDDSSPTTGDAGVAAEHQLVRASNNNTVVIVVDAEKKPTKLAALDWAINVAVQPGDEIVILGVLKHVSTPMGNKVVASTDPVVGASQELLDSEMKNITQVFEQMVSDSGRRAECEKKNVKLTVRIAPGARARTVVVQELAALKATYAVFDRRILRGTRYYNKHLSCHAVRMRSNGRSTKTIFTTSTTTTSKRNNTLTPTSTSTTPTPPWQLRSSSTGNSSCSSYHSGSSPTSDASGGSPSGSNSSSPTLFWRRFTPFKTGSKRNLWSPRATLSPAGSGSTAAPGFTSEMQEFSIALGADGSNMDTAAAGSQQQQRSRSGSKLALESCVVADARAAAYKPGMDSHRSKRRPMSITIPTICAT